MARKPIPQSRPGSSYLAQRGALAKALARVLKSERYILGPEVASLEREFAAFIGSRHGIGVASGTDALILALHALDLTPGAYVATVSHTAVATVAAIELAGFKPLLLDIEPATYTLDPAAFKRALAKPPGTIVAIIPVHLYGQAADIDSIGRLARAHGVKLIEDCAQSHGAQLNGKRLGSLGDISCFSFYPTKNLGAFGDGGAVLTGDRALWERMDSLRVHGKAVASDIEARVFDHEPKYLNARIGMNSRLDTLQAAILIEKLAIFADEIEARQRVAARYAQGLEGACLSVPKVIDGGVSTWAQYVIEHQNRDGLAAHLGALGVPTAVYYPVPMHRQAPYAHFPQGPGGLPVSDTKAKTVIALPMHPYLTPEVQDRIVEAVRGFNG